MPTKKPPYRVFHPPEFVTSWCMNDHKENEAVKKFRDQWLFEGHPIPAQSEDTGLRVEKWFLHWEWQLS